MLNPRLRESLSGVLMHFCKDRAGPSPLSLLLSSATNLKWHTQSRRTAGAVVARSAEVTDGLFFYQIINTTSSYFGLFLIQQAG